MNSCQSGLHHSKLQSTIQNVRFRDFNVNICVDCYNQITGAFHAGEDLTMEILYRWAKEYGDIRELPVVLERDELKTAELVQIVNQELGKMRTNNQDFPTILVRTNEKDQFIQRLENSDPVRRILESNNADNNNICLTAWSGCIDASKTLRDKYVIEHNPDGSTKREAPITAEKRKIAFAQIATKIHDPIYQAGVKAAVVWELRVIGHPDKKIYLDGVPGDSVVWMCIKDKNKKIISEVDLETSNTK